LHKYLKLVEDCLCACVALYLFPYISGRKISYWCRFEVGSGLTNLTRRRLYVVGCLRQPIDSATTYELLPVSNYFIHITTSLTCTSLDNPSGNIREEKPMVDYTDRIECGNCKAGLGYIWNQYCAFKFRSARWLNTIRTNLGWDDAGDQPTVKESMNVMLRRMLEAE